MNIVLGIENIKVSAFYGCPLLANLSFPTEMTSIEAGAFNGCTSIVDLVLPAGASLGNNAFEACNLQTITFPNEKMGTLSQQCFGIQKSITSMDFPGWMKEIPASLCSEWSMLKDVTFNEGIEKIGNQAFQNPVAIETVTLPGSMREIGESAFYSVTSLTSIRFNDGLTSIGVNAFRNCSFMGTTALKSITYAGYDSSAEGASNLVFPPHLQEIKNQAFQGSGIADIPWPSYPIKLGTHIFQDCKQLTSVTIPRWMEQLPDYTFYFGNSGQSNILSVNWEDRSTEGSVDHITIGNFAFQNCGKLQKIDFPEIDIKLSRYAFQHCNSLQSIGWKLWLRCPKCHATTR